MDAFAERTGLSEAREPRRYLWTDAFAVINYLELYRRTADERFKTFARELIKQVHRVLGRHREDDTRSGWLSGLPDEAGEVHPTRGGLRIGKPLPERPLGEPLEERLEWERDGQYFHYLTRWMDALVRAGFTLGDRDYLREAVELANAVFPHFLQRSSSGTPVGLAWKMSIDLSRPQVSSMSPHDALDGYVTFRSLQQAETGERSLAAEIDILKALSREAQWATSHPLGLGGLLIDALRLAILPNRSQDDETLIARILAGVTVGLDHFLRETTLNQPAEARLAFRELGLSIGLQGLETISSFADESAAFSAQAGRYISALRQALASESRIVGFWSEPLHQMSPTWQDHRDINEVMLATAMLRAQVGTALAARCRRSLGA